jgi:hypothetical protein
MGTPIEILADGFRGPPARTNMLFVGDSVTYGTAYVKDADTFPALVGGANGGVNGWGPAECGPPSWRPGRRRLPDRHLDHPHLRRAASLHDPAQRPDQHQPAHAGSAWSTCVRFIWYGHIRTQPAPNDPATFEANQAAVLDLGGRGCGSRAVGWSLVFLPYRDEALGQVLPETEPAQRLREAADRGGHWRCWWPSPAPDAPGYYRDPAHLTPAGNRWLAGVIREYLARPR